MNKSYAWKKEYSIRKIIQPWSTKYPNDVYLLERAHKILKFFPFKEKKNIVVCQKIYFHFLHLSKTRTCPFKMIENISG